MKKISKIVSAFVCLAMAVGVGVAIGSTGRDAEGVKAADEELAFHFRGAAVHGLETSYDARSAEVNSGTTSKVSKATWQITVGNSTAQLGTNAKANNLKKTTLGNGDFSAASGVASALSITTTTQKYAAAYCTTAMANITKGELIFTGTNGGNITTAWLLSSTNGTSWTIESTKTSSISTGSTFSVTKSSTAKQFAFVCYWNLTNAGGLKGFEFKLYGEYDQTGTITSSADEAYSDESVTLTTNASSATWSITSGGSYAHLSSTSGKNVNLIGDAAGSVTVKAVASGYTDATKTITFTQRPTSPFITPTKSSTSGYTGGNETLSFTYGNLAGALGVTSSDTNVVTVGDPSTSAGSGSVQINFVGQGSTTVKFKDGSTELASVSVAVVQTINNVYAETSSENKSTLEFTDEYETQGGDADDGKTWVVTSDGTESTYDPTKGIHYGTGSAAVQYINLTSSDFTTGKITKVVVNASTASGVTATVAVNVGGEAFGGDAKSLTTTAAEYTFEGEVDADEIEVIVAKPSSATKAIYCKSIKVTYETSGSQQIANSMSHMDAQRVAVEFAKAFNDAMDDTENCTTGLSAAWATCTSAYNTFKSQAVALGEAEEAYAKNLVKYATVTEDWPESYPNEACIERMMKVYSVCVNKHGMTAFMSDLVSLAKVSNNSIFGFDSTTAITVIVIISIISVTSIGALLVLRRRKEN